MKRPPLLTPSVGVPYISTSVTRKDTSGYPAAFAQTKLSMPFEVPVDCRRNVKPRTVTKSAASHVVVVMGAAPLLLLRLNVIFVEPRPAPCNVSALLVIATPDVHVQSPGATVTVPPSDSAAMAAATSSREHVAAS